MSQEIKINYNQIDSEFARRFYEYDKDDSYFIKRYNHDQQVAAQVAAPLQQRIAELEQQLRKSKLEMHKNIDDICILGAQTSQRIQQLEQQLAEEEKELEYSEHAMVAISRENAELKQQLAEAKQQQPLQQQPQPATDDEARQWELFKGILFALVANPERYKELQQDAKAGMSQEFMTSKNINKAMIMADAAIAAYKQKGGEQ